jgi:glycosyltransferase involved in cell wall biosynthesis
MLDNPIISVLMPVYNTEKYLSEAIESIINQSFSSWELICVNDGSTDGSLEILRKYEALDKRIIVINQESSGNASIARNVALNYARGEYIHPLDSDDILSNDSLEKTYKTALSTQADFVIPNLIYFKGDVNNVEKKWVGYNGDTDIILSAEEAFVASLSWSISGIALCRTDLIKRHRYNEQGMNGDEYTTRLLLLNCNKIAFCDSIYFYRGHPESTTTKNSLKRFDTIATDFNILQLAKDKNLSRQSIRECEVKVLNNILDAINYLVENENAFTQDEIVIASSVIKENFYKIGRNFIRLEGSIVSYLKLKMLFINFRITKLYITAKNKK